MKNDRSPRFSPGASAMIVLLLCAPTLTFADPAKEFEKLEDQMEAAFEKYVAALAKRDETQDGNNAHVPDARLDVLAKMDALARSREGKAGGGELAIKTFIWSAMFELDGKHLFDRFQRIVKHFPAADGTEEVVTMVPDVFRISGSPAAWIQGLNKIAGSTEKKSAKVAAAFAAAQLSLQTGKLDDAREAFLRTVKLDPDSESGELAKGYIYEIDHLQIGMQAPDFTTTTVEGKKVSLKDLRGKVVLLDFWATWCGPCLAEIPHIKEAADHFKGKPFEVLAVSLDDFKEMLQSTLEQRQLPGIHTWEQAGRENAVATLYNAQVLPTWFLIDAKGIIRAKDTFGDALIPAVEKLMNKR